MPDLLIEIGTEEIPASYIDRALEGLAKELSRAFGEARLWDVRSGDVRSGDVRSGDVRSGDVRSGDVRFGDVRATTFGSPRRLVLHFADLPERGASVTEERTGPSKKIAFDEEGNPTKAAIGFARGQGVEPADLRIRETEKGAYVAVTVTLEGEDVRDVTAAALPRAIRSTPFPKTMRWTGSPIPFARPIRSLVVLYGKEVVPVSAAGLSAGRRTFGHRFLAPGGIDLGSASLSAYREALRERRVLVDPAERRAVIRKGLAEKIGEARARDAHPGLLDEVTHLVEWPGVLEGSIEPGFLELPVEVLETSMRVHLRFFPVLGDDGRPEPRFLAVTDRGPDAADVVREGNERVLRSRLADARFFLGDDQRRTLEELLPELGDKTFHEDLGSYRQKAERLSALAGFVADRAGSGIADSARRAGLLAKTDLVTGMVGEFPELQGTVGRIYASRDGEPAEVAEAIEDHYRPRGPRDELPRGPVATAVSLAEKLDTLVTFFSIGGAPTGGGDPFGLRRQALGLIRVMTENEIGLPLRTALEEAARLAPLSEAEEVVPDVLAFVAERLYQAGREEGLRHDLLRGALAAGFDDLPAFRRRVEALHEMAKEDWWPRLVELAERTANIVRGGAPAPAVDPELFEAEEESALLAAIEEHGPEIEGRLSRGDFVGAGLAMVGAFADPVHDFFERVFVNVDDEGVRGNRLGLLERVNELFAARVADLSSVDRGDGARG